MTVRSIPVGKLARQRREILSRSSVFVDLLSWRYAKSVQNIERGKDVHQSLLGWIKLHNKNSGDFDNIGGNVREEFKQLVTSADSLISHELNLRWRGLEDEMQSKYNPLLYFTDAQQPSMGRNANGKQADHFVPSSNVGDTPNHDDLNFVDKVCGLLVTARYHICSEEEWKYACEHHYGFSVPISVKWPSYDKNLFSHIAPRLYNTPELRTAGADYNGKVKMPMQAGYSLVFHRGVGIDRQRKFFFGQKIDEIIRRSALSVYVRMLNSVSTFRGMLVKKAHRLKEVGNTFFRGMRRGMSYHMAESTTAITTSVYLEPFRKLEDFLRNRVNYLNNRNDKKQRNVSAEHKESTDIDKDMLKYNGFDSVSNEANDRLLERAIRARISLSEIRLNVRQFFSKVTLQEPTYEDVVVFYRLLKPRLPSVVSISQGEYFRDARQSKPESSGLDGRNANKRNIFIKHFRNVPMTDLELLFPKKQVFLKLSDKINYSFMALVGGSALYNLLESPLHITSSAWFAAILASGSYFLRVLTRMYTSWAYYSEMTNGALAENMTSSGISALTWITKEAQEQLCKEVVTAFLAMVELSLPVESTDKTTEFFEFPAISSIQVADKCVHILRQKYSAEVNEFDSKHALAELQRIGIIERVDTTGSGEFLYRLIDYSK